jgi:hypothetical protein
MGLFAVSPAHSAESLWLSVMVPILAILGYASDRGLASS